MGRTSIFEMMLEAEVLSDMLVDEGKRKKYFCVLRILRVVS